jgi:DNA-binding CsgD family transcriptional regulator
VSLGRAAYLAGDIDTCLESATTAAALARAIGDVALAGEAALVVEVGTGPGVNSIANELCEHALADLGETGNDALRARLLAQRSHLAFYDGDAPATELASAAALGLARRSGDDRALIDALHARKEALPGPPGRRERLDLATEMLALAQRTNSARPAMWGELWRTEALIESGALRDAAEELAALAVAVERVGGPVSAWHLDRVTACVAQAQGRYADAASIARRAFERMQPVEPRPARGAFFAHQCVLGRHLGITDELAAFVEQPFESLPLFATFGRLNLAVVLLLAGRTDDAAAAYRETGPVDGWALPAFYVLGGYVTGILAAAGIGEDRDLVVLLELLEPFRGEHVAGEGVTYMGPVELALGLGKAALGHLDAAIDDLEAAVTSAERAGASGFVAEAHVRLASALLDRDATGDRDRAVTAARNAERLAHALGMAPYVELASALVARLDAEATSGLSAREVEVADLVAEGLTNRQIAERLFISQRTAQNHVQHILTKLGFTTRSQIAAWRVRSGE